MFEGNTLEMAATDGYRISIAKTEMAQKVDQDFKALVPARALSELSRIASDGDEALMVAFPSGRGGQVIFHMKDIELVSQLIEGAFPITPPLFLLPLRRALCFQPRSC